jgi:hypothetical protein
MNEEDEDEKPDEQPAFIVNSSQTGPVIAQSAPASGPGISHYVTTSNGDRSPPRPLSLTPGPTSSSESASPSPPPSTVPHTANIPMASTARAISKPSPYTRRSSLSAYPPSSWGRRGSTPGNLSVTPSRSPVTDSLYVPETSRQNVSSSLSTVRILEEYDGLASPNRARRLSNLRSSRPDDLFDDEDPVTIRHPAENGHTSPNHHHHLHRTSQKTSHDRNDSANHSVFGDMED